MQCRRLDIITIIVIAAICYTYTRMKEKKVKICFFSNAVALVRQSRKKEHEHK
jgi:hypothetical protein